MLTCGSSGWIQFVSPCVLCVWGGGAGARLRGGAAAVTPAALLPRLQMFWTILGSSFIYNIGLPSVGLLQGVPALSQRE